MIGNDGLAPARDDSPVYVTLSPPLDLRRCKVCRCGYHHSGEEPAAPLWAIARLRAQPLELPAGSRILGIAGTRFRYKTFGAFVIVDLHS